MDHTLLAQLFGLLAAICMSVVGILYRDFLKRVKSLENNQKIVIATLYHLAVNLSAPLPAPIRERIERMIMNGERK